MSADDLPVPVAARLRAPGWRDARLVVGIVLVLTSITLGSVVVSRADDRAPLYAARTTLIPGRRLSEADLTRVEVQLGAAAAQYVSAGGFVGRDRFVLREVRPGELVPAASVGTQDQVRIQPITVSVDAGSAAALVVGSQVDVYVNPLASRAGSGPGPAATAGLGGSPDSSGGTYAGPQLTLHAAAVAALPRQDGALGGGSSLRPVQIMAPTEAIRGLIALMDEGSRVTLVPVPGAVLESSQ